MLSRKSHDERSHLELITVYEICRILGASLDTGRTFRVALNVLTAHLGLPRAMVVVADENDETLLRVHSSAGLSSDQHRRGVWRKGEGIIGRVFASGLPAVVPDVGQAAEFVNRRLCAECSQSSALWKAAPA